MAGIDNTLHSFERLMLLGLLFFVALCIGLHFNSDMSQSLRKAKPVSLVLLGKPAALITYDPAEMKATVEFAAKTPEESSGSASQRAVAVKSQFQENRDAGEKIRFFIPPAGISGTAAWESYRDWLNNWKRKPLLLLRYFSAYYSARAAGQCNIPFYDFALITMELTKLGITDFFVSSDEKKNIFDSAPEQEYAGGGEPLVVEVFNATQKKGFALKVTEFLRGLDREQGRKVDVLRYDNYRSIEKKSRILAHTGRLKELSELSKRLGLNSTEILSSARKINYSDATIIVGEDLVIPE